MKSEVVLKNRRYYQKRLSFLLPFFDFKNSTVLDLGCGEMILEPFVLKNGGAYTGIDLLEYDTASDLIQGNVFDPLLTQNMQFDYIFCLGVLDHMTPSQQNVLFSLYSAKCKKTFTYNLWNRNSIWQYLFVGKKYNPEMEKYAQLSNKMVYILKIPFTQWVFKLKKNKLNKFFATEIIYLIEHVES